MATRCIIGLGLLVFAATAANVPLQQVRAFQQPPGTNPADLEWPELQTAVGSRPPYALVFSGGGSRAYVAAMGILGALTELGVVDRIRYLGGASGGGWATAAYSYYQPNTQIFRAKKGQLSASSDEELLGNITFPSEITEENLETIAPTCLRGSVNKDVIERFAKQFLHYGFHFHKVFIAGVHDVYLSRAGIPSPYDKVPTMFSYDAATVEDIRKRNPLVRNEFIFPTPGRPFPTLGFTLLGPTSLLPLNKDNRTYSILESNPLYTGRPDTCLYTYHTSSKKKSSQEKLVGGAIESWTFGTANKQGVTLPPSVTVGVLAANLTMPSEPFTLAHAAATCGWAGADEIAAQVGKLAPLANDLFGLDYPYFSSGTPPGDTPSQPSDQFSFGDSGITENLHLISLLRREGLKGFLCMTMTEQPMNLTEKWDPTKRRPTPTDIDDTIPNYFGIDPDKPDPAWDYSRNQVFETAQFVPFVQALQAAIVQGDGAVVQMTLNVVDNKYWGIRGGRTVDVTWVYLSRTFNWEAQLPDFLKKQMVPSVKDPSVLPGKNSPYPLFPHYPTFDLTLSAPKSNLLANMMGWIILRHQDKICPFLGLHNGCPRESARMPQ